MWSQKFVWVGLSTGTAFAAIAVFAAWYVFFAITAATGGTNLGWIWGQTLVHPSLPMPALSEVVRAFFGARALAPDLSVLGVIVYPACWFYRIQRRRKYSIPATLELVAATYITSCVVVGIVFCLFTAGLAVRDVIPEAVRRVWEAMASTEPTLNWHGVVRLIFLLFVLPIVGSASFMLFGGAIMLVPFIFVGPAVAFLHRWLLLAAFSPAQPSGAASP